MARRVAHFEPYLDMQIQELLKDAVLETGSNENGYWRKWSDGTLECWGRVLFSDITFPTQVSTFMFYSTVCYLPWAAEFSSLPESHIDITAYNRKNGSGLIYIAFGSSEALTTRSNNFYFVVVDGTVNTKGDIVVSYSAKGRWKA